MAWGRGAAEDTSATTPTTTVVINVSTANTTRTGTWAIPANVTKIDKIEVWGGGASGGQARGTANRASGGGAGAYAAIFNLDVTGLSVLNYQVGAGGAAITGATNGTAGAAGTDTWVNKAAASAPTLATNGALAKGGTAGKIASGSNATASNGGASASCIGSVVFSGGNSGAATGNGGATGGGGAATMFSNGANAANAGANASGAGGAAGTGGGAGGAAATAAAANVEGAGGGGGSNSASGGRGGDVAGGGGASTAASGVSGAGGDGQIRITYTTPAAVAAALAGSLVDAVSASGTLTTQILLVGNIVCQAASGTAALNTAILLGGGAVATAGTSAALSTAIPLSGGVVATASVSAALTTGIPLSGTAGAVASTGPPALATQILLVGAPAGQASAGPAALTTAIPLAAAALGVSAASAGLTATIRLSADAAGLSATTGALTAAIRLSGGLVGAASVTGDLQIGSGLAGSLTAASATAGALSTQIRLSGGLTAVAATAGALSTQVRLSGGLAAAATTAGALSAQITLGGQAVSSATASASFAVLAADLAGSLAAQASVAGALTAQITLAGGVVGQAAATADLTTSAATTALAGSAFCRAAAAATPFTVRDTITRQAAVAVPLPQTATEIVGFALQNTSGSASAAQWIRFAKQFFQGEVPSGRYIEARIGASTVPVQTDVIQRWPDNSVKWALCLLKQAAVAGSSNVTGMLRQTTTAPGTALATNHATAVNGYNLSVSFTTTAPTATTYSFDAATVLATGLAGGAGIGPGKYEVLRQGDQCVEIRVQVEVVNALRLVFDIASFSDGSTRTIIQFNNDLIMRSGWTYAQGAVTYSSITITQSSATKFSRATSLTQQQYQNFLVEVTDGTSAAQTLNHVHDIDYLQRQSILPNFDLTSSAFTTQVNSQNNTMSSLGANFTSVLGVNGLLQNMTAPGARPDIGISTAGNALWMVRQTAETQRYAIGQAWAGGSPPWNTWDPVNLHPINVVDEQVGIWMGNNTSPNPPTQNYNSSSGGWTPDQTHLADLFYVPWALIGDWWMHDRLQNCPSWHMASSWDGYRIEGQYVWLNERMETRGQAWGLRSGIRALKGAPDGSYAQSYAANLVNRSYSFFNPLIPSRITQQGQHYGILPYTGDGTVDRYDKAWQGDYLGQVAMEAVRTGITGAKVFADYTANWSVERFYGFGALTDATLNPKRMAYAYQGYYKSGTTTRPSTIGPDNPNPQVPLWYGTWSGVFAATKAQNEAPYQANSNTDGYYAELAYTAQCEHFTTYALGTSAADHRIAARAARNIGWMLADDIWKLANSEPGRSAGGDAYLTGMGDPQYIQVPRARDTYQIPMAWQHVVSAASGASISFTSQRNVLIYDQGGGGATLTASAGGSVLIDATTGGGDTLIGGASDDYLLGGVGTNLFRPNGGWTYCEVGTGAAVIEVSPSFAGTIEVAGFRPGTDKLKLMGSAAGSTANLLAAAQDTADGVVLTLSDTRNVRLNGVSSGSLAATDFVDNGVAGALTAVATASGALSTGVRLSGALQAASSAGLLTNALPGGLVACVATALAELHPGGAYARATLTTFPAAGGGTATATQAVTLAAPAQTATATSVPRATASQGVPAPTQTATALVLAVALTAQAIAVPAQTSTAAAIARAEAAQALVAPSQAAGSSNSSFAAAAQTLAAPAQAATAVATAAASAATALALPGQAATVVAPAAATSAQGLTAPSQGAVAAATAKASAAQALILPTQVTGSAQGIAATAVQGLLAPTQAATLLAIPGASQSLSLGMPGLVATAQAEASGVASQGLGAPTQAALATITASASADQALALPAQFAGSSNTSFASVAQTAPPVAQAATAAAVATVATAQALARPAQAAEGVAIPLSLVVVEQALLPPAQDVTVTITAVAVADQALLPADMQPRAGAIAQAAAAATTPMPGQVAVVGLFQELGAAVAVLKLQRLALATVTVEGRRGLASQRFWPGETVRVIVTFTDLNEAPTAAGGVAITARRPDGALVDGVVAPVSGSPGSFYADFTAVTSGTWAVRATCESPTPAVDEAEFVVATSLVGTA